MLLEFDADQRLWQETVRDAVTKQCPASLVRGIAEDGVDPAPLWKTYVDAGWTELTDPENAVELAIVLEELGRATDPTPFLATLTQFAPLAGDRFDPQQSGTAVYSGVTAHRDADGWVLQRNGRITSSTATAPRGSRWSPTRASSSSTPVRPSPGVAPSSTRCCTSPRCPSPVARRPTPTASASTPSGPATWR